MLVRKVDIDTDNMQWTHFNSSFEQFSFKIAIFVTNFIRNFIHKDDIVNMWCIKESVTFVQLALTIIRNIRLYLEDEWQRLQPLKVNYIVIPNFREQSDNVANLESIIYK